MGSEHTACRLLGPTCDAERIQYTPTGWSAFSSTSYLRAWAAARLRPGPPHTTVSSAEQALKRSTPPASHRHGTGPDALQCHLAHLCPRLTSTHSTSSGSVGVASAATIVTLWPCSADGVA